MDIAVHIGTLLSVLLYFRRDVIGMLFSLKDLATGNITSEGSKLSLFVLVGSIPVIIAGLIVSLLAPDWIRTLYVIATTTLVFGIVLWWADAKTSATRRLEDMTYRDAILIGLAQTLALIPGTSRSGITITAARFLGFSRTESAHYSMLLAIVAISAAGALTGLKLLESENLQLGFDVLLGVAFSFISSYLALAVMMKFLETRSFTIFAIYRIILGSALLGLLLTGVIH